MAGYDLNTAAGQAEFERRMTSIIKNEVGSYTRTALSQSLGGVQQTQNNLDNTNLSIVPIGSIIAFGGVELPGEFLWCDGSLIRKDKYARLFSVLGPYRYGTDTADEFYLPDFRNKFIRGTSNVNANATITNNNTHNHSNNVTNSGNHTHNVNGSSTSSTGGHNHNVYIPGSNNTGSTNGGNAASIVAIRTHDHGGYTTSTGDHNHSNYGANANAAGDHSHIVTINSNTENIPAYVTVNYIIKY